MPCACYSTSVIFFPLYPRRADLRRRADRGVCRCARRAENFHGCCTRICWAESWVILKWSGMRPVRSRCGAGQSRLKDGILFFDIWTSFAPSGGATAGPAADASISALRIRASVEPPTRLQAATEMNVQIRSGGERALVFELSRYLKIDAVEADGRPVDFIQNPAVEGTQLQRKGNDLVALVFSMPLRPGRH